MPDLSRWTLRVFEPRDGCEGLMFYVQSDAGLAWGRSSPNRRRERGLGKATRTRTSCNSRKTEMRFPYVFWLAVAEGFYGVRV